MIIDVYKGFPFKPEIGCFGIASSYLIKDKINILFDTGGYGARKKIIDLINKKEIDCVVISHLHFDHCSNLDLFIETDIPIYISKIEYEEYEKNKGIDCDLFSYFKFIKDKLKIIFVENKLKLTDSINIISTPGHTLGHISLEIIKNKNMIFSGDAIKSYKDYCDLNSFGNCVDRKRHCETKKFLIDNYEYIFCGHDGVIKNGKLDGRGDICEF